MGVKISVSMAAADGQPRSEAGQARLEYRSCSPPLLISTLLSLEVAVIATDYREEATQLDLQPVIHCHDHLLQRIYIAVVVTPHTFG